MEKIIKEHTEWREGTLSEILLSATAGSTIYEQLGNFLFTGKGWLLSSHESGNEKKNDCITQKKRCFLKKGDRALPLLKQTHTHTGKAKYMKTVSRKKYFSRDKGENN